MARMSDIDMLCQAIDAGDDFALPILADALEDAGDSRAPRLRQVAVDGYRPGRSDVGWGWTLAGHSAPAGASVAGRVWAHLRGVGESPEVVYASQSEAYLALAEAITSAVQWSEYSARIQALVEAGVVTECEADRLAMLGDDVEIIASVSGRRWLVARETIVSLFEEGYRMALPSLPGECCEPLWNACEREIENLVGHRAGARR